MLKAAFTFASTFFALVIAIIGLTSANSIARPAYYKIYMPSKPGIPRLRRSRSKFQISNPK